MSQTNESRVKKITSSLTWLTSDKLGQFKKSNYSNT